MIFLNNLYIQNYKCLKNLKLKNFGDLNIFIGPNNSGKTSILNSVNILQNIEMLNDASFQCEWCRGLSELEKNEFKNLEIFPVGCNISSNDQYLRENKISVLHEFSKETFNDILSPYLDQISRQIEQLVSKLVSGKEKVDADIIIELIIKGILKDLQNSTDLSEEKRYRIGRFFRSYISNVDRKRRPISNNGKNLDDIKTAIILFSNNYDKENKKLTSEIIYGINDIVGDSLTQNVNNSYIDDIKFEYIIKQAKNEYFLNHLMKDHGIDCDPLYKLVLRQHSNTTLNSRTLIFTPHFSLFCISQACRFLKDHVYGIEDDRLRTYRNKNLDQYIKDKNLTGKQMIRLMELLKSIVDPNIKDYNIGLDLVRNDDFITSISEQGSGVRSLICLVTDILSTKTNSIILIDEPELGLNPSAKKEFLKFLIEESKTKQIFITTHDPIFVNPTIWSNYNTKISVYLYSLSGNDYKKIDLDQAKNDPSTFGGYLPHTTCLKKIHLYVEGSSDVYIFQEYLRKFLIKTNKAWAERWNNIGIYHLNGDYWQHLLYTIPKSPYKCAIILDGDKKKLAKKVCEQYNKSSNHEEFEFCTNGLIDFERVFSGSMSKNTFPVYCLKKDTIEDYFSDLIENNEVYDKKVDGPEIVRELENIPEEFVNIFKIITDEIEKK